MHSLRIVILVNGRIHTVDEANPAATAVAIRDGRFVAVGSDDEIRALAGTTTRVEDLGGATVVPGLIDAHNHLQATGRMLREVQLFDTRAIPEIVARVAERVRETAAGAVDRRARLGRKPAGGEAPSDPARPRRGVAGQPGRHPSRLEQARLQHGRAAGGRDQPGDTRSASRRPLQRVIRARRARVSQRDSSATAPRR